LALVPGAIVCYESPHRVAATLASVAEVMPGRRVALVRELTKLHEEVVRGEAAALAAAVAARGEIRGECVIVIAPPTAEELEERRRGAVAAGAPTSLEEAIHEGLAAGEPKSALAKRLAKEFSVPRAEVYDQVAAAAASAEP
jgi:16S rRNA (cytidine1402-2'-O)-methyltransferase